ncbi:MAG: hypothetical protein UX81_C0016G0011 [Parcubacteria group bacterium GW2011_GWA2_47_12]|nr:MAG: hypothetical protein UX81_C0016G0011 [Parcubacteria group bacterium GW2011_GWA2_47_12]
MNERATKPYDWEREAFLKHMGKYPIYLGRRPEKGDVIYWGTKYALEFYNTADTFVESGIESFRARLDRTLQSADIVNLPPEFAEDLEKMRRIGTGEVNDAVHEMQLLAAKYNTIYLDFLKRVDE